MKKLLILTLFVIIFLITSCSMLDRSAKITYNECELSLDDIAELKSSFETECENTKHRVVETYSADFVPDAVYWTDGGAVWHIELTCRYLRSVEEIIEGSVENAICEGKTRQCSACADKK